MLPANANELEEHILQLLDEEGDRPWCVHRIYEALGPPRGELGREGALSRTEAAADRLVTAGRARKEVVSAISIGIHCEDSLYWSPKSGKLRLSDFGPSFESPTILRRLGSHFVCRGL